MKPPPKVSKRVAVIAGGSVYSLIAAIHALAPSVRDVDALDAIERDNERMIRTAPPRDGSDS